MARLIESIVGHEVIWKRVLALIGREHLPHAMAFVGPPGIGKKKMAWAVAQALVCADPARPCGQCPPCKRVEARQSESVLDFEPTATGAIKLESAQTILHALSLQSPARARVVLIDGAQSLNPQAANALLKVIEEPPANVFFILIVNEASQFLPTLRSRLQVQRFAPLSEEEMRRVLGKGEKEALSETVPDWMIRCARGSMERLEAFRDPRIAGLRTLTLQFVSDALRGRREGLEELLDQTKDRETAKRAIAFLQQMLHDWCLAEYQPSLIHSDLMTRVLLEFPQVANERRLELWRSTFAMEMDLVAHVDRGLLFENFFYRLKSTAFI